MAIRIHSVLVIAVEHLVGKKENGSSHGVMVVIVFLDKSSIFVLANQTVISSKIEHGALKADETPGVPKN